MIMDFFIFDIIPPGVVLLVVVAVTVAAVVTSCYWYACSDSRVVDGAPELKYLQGNSCMTDVAP